MSPFLLFTLLLTSFTTTTTTATSDLLDAATRASEKIALLLLRSSVGSFSTKLNWDLSHSSPCKWFGVTCDFGRVTALRLPSAFLFGQLPIGIFGNLTQLRVLNLHSNSLSGALPSDFGQCVELRFVFLQGNSFTGPFPEMFDLKELERLDLANNRFSGELPTEISLFKNLKTLYLEGNRFNGTMPELRLRSLQQFNVSNNDLNGPLPETLKSYGANAFAGNVGLCGEPLKACGVVDPLPIIGVNDHNENGNVVKKIKVSSGVIVCIVIGLIIGFLLILVVVYLLWRRMSERKRGRGLMESVNAKDGDIESHDEKMPSEVRHGGGGEGSDPPSLSAAAASVLTSVGKGGVSSGGGGVDGAKKLMFFEDGEKAFDLEDLLRASAKVLGKGTFGTVFKAVLDRELVLAVKRLKNVIISERELREKVEVIGEMDNPNLVPLKAYYFNSDEKLLVFDYMPMGSLSALLHGNRELGTTPLSWNVRFSIALGAARGIEFLHSQGPTISHGNIKSSNILLTSSYEARVSDFGLAQLLGPSSMSSRVSGYRAPEVTDPRRVSQKADVYSFGVLLLELLTGKAPMHAILNKEGVDLPRWVHESIVREEWLSEVFDVELLRSPNAEKQMVQLLQLAIDCTSQYPDNRPSMSEVAKHIDDVQSSST